MARCSNLTILLWWCAISGLVAAETASPALPQPSTVPTKTTVLKIGAEDDYYPYSAKRNGRTVGMAAEIISAAFAATNVDFEFVSLPYARCMSETSKGEIAGCFDTLRSPLNETQYFWPKIPLFLGRINIYAPANHPEKLVTISDLKGKTVATTHGYEYGEAFDSDKSIKRDSRLTDIIGLRNLSRGKVDYGVFSEQITNHLLLENPELAGKIKSVGSVFEGELYLCFSKDYPNIKQIIEQFDAGMDIIQANGDYAKIVKKWEIQ
jgi:polar amino acid transport system substrate-binding protein